MCLAGQAKSRSRCHGCCPQLLGARESLGCEGLSLQPDQLSLPQDREQLHSGVRGATYQCSRTAGSFIANTRTMAPRLWPLWRHEGQCHRGMLISGPLFNSATISIGSFMSQTLLQGPELWACSARRPEQLLQGLHQRVIPAPGQPHPP